MTSATASTAPTRSVADAEGRVGKEGKGKGGVRGRGGAACPDSRRSMSSRKRSRSSQPMLMRIGQRPAVGEAVVWERLQAPLCLYNTGNCYLHRILLITCQLLGMRSCGMGEVAGPAARCMHIHTHTHTHTHTHKIGNNYLHRKLLITCQLLVAGPASAAP